jgi:hypothetical protein
MEGPISDDPRHQEIRRRVAQLRHAAPDVGIPVGTGS